MTDEHTYTATLDLDPKDASFSQMLGSMRDIMGSVHDRFQVCAAEKASIKLELEQTKNELGNMRNPLPPPCAVAEGKQKEAVALLNALYESGIINRENVTKKEFMQHMADALGCPGMADYSRALNTIKQTYKYDDIFDNLSQVAQKEKTKND